MSRILIRLNKLNETQKGALREEIESRGDEAIFITDKEVAPALLATADAIIGNIHPASLQNALQLRWLQLNSSGTDAYVKPGVVPDGVVLTCATGAYGIGISEYMIAQLLNLMKRIPAYYDNQKKACWHDEGLVTSPMGKRVLVVGTGNIGTEFAKRMKVFGAEIVGIRRRAGVCPEGFAEIHPMEALREQAARADIIALTLPGTAATYHLFNEDVLLACKKGAYLLNVGRGNVVDHDALVKESVWSNFAGIYLDVCECEPLPAEDPLWHVPNLLLTPHITGDFHLDITAQNICDIAMHNYRAFKGECEYRSVVDKASGYAV